MRGGMWCVTAWDQRKPLEEPNCSGGRGEQRQESLNKENVGADQYQEFYAWGYEAAPVEVVAPRAEGASHSPSLRRLRARVKRYAVEIGAKLSFGPCRALLVISPASCGR